MKHEHPVPGPVHLAEPDPQQVAEALDLLDVQSLTEVPDVLQGLESISDRCAIVDVDPAMWLAGIVGAKDVFFYLKIVYLR